MAAISGHYRHRSGTDAQRAAATIHAREIHFTGSDRKELWIGAQMIGGYGYHAFAPDPSVGGYAVGTTLNFPPWYREHVGRVAPVEYSGDYEHTVILPNADPGPRNGDKALIFSVLPACVAHSITLTFRNATVGGTDLGGQLIAPAGGAARKWLHTFLTTGGVWELVAAVELLV